MKNLSARRNPPSLLPAEKNSEKLLMEKMGMSKKELQEVNSKYGVSASQLIELMQLSRYQFIYANKVQGQCEPCHSCTGKLRAVNF